MLPFFSIVIPTKNNEDLIGKCMKSIRELDYPQDRIEVIVSDGKSTDATREIALSYGAIVILDHHNISVCSARNAAFEVVKGDYIAMCDADCVVHKDWLKNSLKYFDNPKVGGIGGANLIPKDETPFGKAVGILFAYAPMIVKAANTRILNKVIESRSHGSNAIYRAEVLKQVVPIDESVVGGEDVIMNDKIVDLGYKLLYVPDVLVDHYRRPNIKRWWNSMYRYGMGRVILPKHRKGEVAPLHIVAGYAIPLFFILVIFAMAINSILLLWLLYLIIIAIVLSIIIGAIIGRSLKVGLNLPIVLAVFIIAWSCGYLHELLCEDKGEKCPES